MSDLNNDWRLLAIIGTLDIGDEFFVGTASPSDPLPDQDDPELSLPRLLTASWRDQLTEDGSWPAVQAVSTGTLSILFETAEDAATLGAGRPVFLRLSSPTDPATVVSDFAGRISDPELEPHRLGVVATFTLIDYLADLAEVTVGEDFNAGEAQWGRLVAFFDEADIPAPSMPPGGAGFLYSVIAERDPDPAPLLDLAQHVLASCLIESTDTTSRMLYELRPNIDGFGGLDLDEPYTVSPLPRETPAASSTLSASLVEYGAKWTRSLFSDTNTVHIVSGDKVVARASNRAPGEHRVTLRRESSALSGDATADLAEYLLPDPEWVPGWEADEFNLRFERLPGWPANLREAVTITDLNAAHNPNGGTEWTGVVTSTQTRIAGDKVTIGLTLSDRPLSS